MEIVACVTKKKNIQPLYKTDLGEVYFSQAIKEMPDNLDVLFSERELAKIKRLHRNKHRVSVLIKGRLMIKEIIRAKYKKHNLDWLDIEIVNKEDQIKGVPEIFIKNKREDINVSISYTGNYVSVALSKKAAVGVDIEMIHEYSASFLRMFYSKEKMEEVISLDKVGQTESWCIQEAVLKAMGTGFGIGLKKLEIKENNNSNEADIICIRERNICQVICYIKKKSRSL